MATRTDLVRKSVRKIDPELWQIFRAECTFQRREIGEMLSELMAKWLESRGWQQVAEE